MGILEREKRLGKGELRMLAGEIPISQENEPSAIIREPTIEGGVGTF